jgi:hypothetical protein
MSEGFTSNGPLVLLKFPQYPQKLAKVAEYCQFLGRRVTVRYRLGDILLSATGTFCADSGRSIFLEQSLEQRGTRKYFRWEIPYPYIYRVQIEATTDAETPGTQNEHNGATVQKQETAESSRKAAATAAGESSNRASSLTFLNPRTSEETA